MVTVAKFLILCSHQISNKNISATEITENGKRLTSLISELLGYDIVVGHGILTLEWQMFRPFLRIASFLPLMLYTMLTIWT